MTRVRHTLQFVFFKPFFIMNRFNSTPIVITRPRSQAEALSGQLTALDFDAIQSNRVCEQKSRRSGRTKGLCWPREVQIAVMRRVSLTQLARFGVRKDNATIVCRDNVYAADSESLLNWLNLSGMHGRQMLIVKGEVAMNF